MKREQLKEYFRRQYNLLVEQEEEDPFATDDEGGDEEAADEGGDEGDEGGEGEGEEGEDEGEEEEAEVEVAEEDRVRLGKSMDDQLQAVLIDIESEAIKSAAVQAESKSILQIYLNEQSTTDVVLDTDRFAAEVARVVKNFDSFFDIEEMVLSKVRSFLLDKHGEEVAQQVEDLLAARHNIRHDEDVRHEEEEVDLQVPLAVGAAPGGGGGGV